MPAIFEKITETVVKELDSGGSMIAAKSIVCSDKFCCSSLVKRKKNFLGESYYYSTGLTLEDILESAESNVLDSRARGPIAKLEFQDEVDTKFSMELHQKVIIESSFKHSKQGQEISVFQQSMTQKYLNSLDNRKLREELPPSFKSIRDKREDLYLVSGVLKNEKEEILKKTWEVTFCSKVREIVSILSFKAKCKVHHERSVTIPDNRVLAYQVEQLFFHNEGKMNIFVPDKKNSFPEKHDNAACKGRSGALEDSENLEDFGNFESLKENVEDVEEILEDLTVKEKQALLDCLNMDVQQLGDLKQRVSAALCSGELQMEEDKEDNTVDTLIKCLFNDAGILVEERAEAILKVLEALIDLSEDLQLVDELRKNGTLPQLKEQVESALKQNGDEQPPDVDDDLETRNLYALYFLFSILLQLNEKASSEYS